LIQIFTSKHLLRSKLGIWRIAFSRSRFQRHLKFCVRPGLVRSPVAGLRFLTRLCGIKSVAEKKPPTNGWIRSTCTMLYGHIETLEHRVDHLRQLRELQDETAGFTGFVPFAFEPQTTILSHIKQASAMDQLRNLAVSRIYLDNIDHITAYWVSMGLPLAQLSLSYGVDDLHGTILEEKIFHMAGATTPQQQSIATLEHAIREAGREPMQRDSHYRHIRARSTNGAHVPSIEAQAACA
jgi:CofH/MqnC-like protein